ncbi:MAG TPA: serine/threonine-protein kinase [Polyangiaceae bacterium]|nr:serine/threonine-protein kinase [Polyangiaceae bacterium]
MPKWFPSFKRGGAVAVAEKEPVSRAPLSSAAALASDDDDLVGKNLNGTYVLESVLGEGGMGRVYRARHTRIASKQFAIKVLRPEFTRNPEVVARFRREAEAAACISHPNVVGVYDVDATPDGHSYLVCEYLIGHDLADEIATHGPLAMAEAVHIVVQVCKALEAAHARGVVHRDLKPHNVFLLANERGVMAPRPAVRVLDFGLSRFVDAPGTQLTQTGVIMGTPAYMAPEQADGTGVDLRTDVYGLGAVLFAAVCGRPPFEADTLQAVVLAVLSQEAPRARTINPAVPENLELVIQRAMSRRREERYQTMGELRRALEPFLAVDELEIVEDDGATRAAMRSSRSLLEADARAVSTARPRLVFYGVLALVLLIAGISSTLPALELVTGKLTFTRPEVALFLAAVVGTLITPTLVLFARFRRTVWGNHARVLGLLHALRGAVTAGVLSYGFAAIAVHFLDDVVGRIFTLPWLGHTSGQAWPGWNLLFLAIALVTSGVSGARIGIERQSSGILRRVTPVLTFAGAVVCLFILYAGFLWRSHSPQLKGTSRDAAPAVSAEDPPAPQPSAAPAASVGSAPAPDPGASSAALASSATSAVAHAPTDELARAVALGTDGLIPLAETYPKDPAVLKPLVIAFASRSTGLADAMSVATRLFDAAPEATADPDLRFLVKKAAGTPGQASKLALDAMTDHMGSAGPDLLYELMLNDTKTTKQAQALLASSAVRERETPALSVAYDLRNAQSCSAKVPLLKRVAELGDDRSIAILAPLATGSKKGCGKKKKEACPPPCADEAKKFNEAISRIVARGGATRH